MKKIFVTILVSFVSMGALAQQPWQKIQMPTAASVQRAWIDPPPEYGPEPYYGLNGAVNQTVIERDLDTMKALGYRAVTVQAGYGMPFAYLSPEYFKFFRMFVDEAKKREMRVWIVDDAGYPSGFAGGKFTAEKPELRMQAAAMPTIPVFRTRLSAARGVGLLLRRQIPLWFPPRTTSRRAHRRRIQGTQKSAPRILLAIPGKGHSTGTAQSP